MNLELFRLIKNLSKWDCEFSDISPLTDFLNMEKKDITEYKDDAILLRDDKPYLSIEAILNLYEELKGVLIDMFGASSISSRSKSDAVCFFLSEKLRRVRNKVVFVEQGSKQVRVNMVCDDIIADIWGNMICIFLSTPHWEDVLGKCPQCVKWFRKRRMDQIYCHVNCRSKDNYMKHKEARQESRRLKYKRGKERKGIVIKR